MGWRYDPTCRGYRCTCDRRPRRTCPDPSAVRLVRACECSQLCGCSSDGSDEANIVRLLSAAASLLLGDPAGAVGSLLG